MPRLELDLDGTFRDRYPTIAQAYRHGVEQSIATGGDIRMCLMLKGREGVAEQGWLVVGPKAQVIALEPQVQSVASRLDILGIPDRAPPTDADIRSVCRMYNMSLRDQLRRQAAGPCVG